MWRRKSKEAEVAESRPAKASRPQRDIRPSSEITDVEILLRGLYNGAELSYALFELQVRNITASPESVKPAEKTE